VTALPGLPVNREAATVCSFAKNEKNGKSITDSVMRFRIQGRRYLLFFESHTVIA